MTYTCAARGTCNPGCPMYGVCHCGCGEMPTMPRWNSVGENEVGGQPHAFVRYHHKRDPQAKLRGRKYSRSGVPIALVLPDLRALLHLHGSQRRVAQELGCAQSWVNAMLGGKVRRTNLGMAQKIAEIARGGRNLDADWRKEERLREQRDRHNSNERKRQRPIGRKIIRHDEHVCTHCGGRCASAHALFMHSRKEHGDKTQGKMWDWKLNA